MLRDAGKSGALAVQVDTLNQRLPILGAHDHPSPTLRCACPRFGQYRLQLGDAPSAFVHVISGAAEKLLAREGVNFPAWRCIPSDRTRACAP